MVAELSESRVIPACPRLDSTFPASGATINEPESLAGEGRGHRHYQAEGGISAFRSSNKSQTFSQLLFEVA